MLYYDQVSQETGEEPGALRGLSWPQLTVQAAILTVLVVKRIADV